MSYRYSGNIPKEDRLLEKVREFERNFVSVYGKRFLFLSPPNEMQIPKFLPTSIRPTHLPYEILYEYASCAAFVADFVNYEELSPPDKYPPTIPSPCSVLKWQAGDCFDMAIALCSLLTGVNYDAYCVAGYAPRFVSKRIEARQKPPVLAKRNSKNKKQNETEEEYILPRKVRAQSKFLARCKEEKENERARLEEHRGNSDSDYDPSSSSDEELSDNRIHCWVLLKNGLRELSEDLFIEPSTGRVYPVRESPYLRIDILWNHKNLWVNMQKIPAPKCEFNLMNPQFFEHVIYQEFANEEAEKSLEDNDIVPPPSDVEDTEEPVLEQDEASFPLDLPSSWSDRLQIPKDVFEARCYQGEKITFYDKCKVEQYAPYSQLDGIIRRVTQYKDLRRQIPLSMTETFAHRRDKLVKRFRYPKDNKVIEQFDKGRPSCLKEFREDGMSVRELIYYPSRLDGLLRSIEHIGHKIMEYFGDRDNKLVYHSVTLDASLPTVGPHGGTAPMLHMDLIGDMPIRKLTEKYDQREGEKDISSTDAVGQNIAKAVYYHAEGKIRVDYHKESGSATYPSLTFWKEDNSLRLDEGVKRDIPVPSQVQMQALLYMEKNSKQIFVEAIAKTNAELAQRRKEENHIRSWRGVDKADVSLLGVGLRESILEKSVYVTARERAQAEVLSGNAAMEEEKEKEDTSKIDILAPYLVDFQGKQLDPLQAEFVAKKCKNDFRKRLLDRAQIIQKRLEEEQDQLKKRRSQMQRRGDNAEKDEKAFEQYQSNAMFRIQILEQRLSRHEMQAIKKFSELEKTLAEDPRLAGMWLKGPGQPTK